MQDSVGIRCLLPHLELSQFYECNSLFHVLEWEFEVESRDYWCLTGLAPRLWWYQSVPRDRFRSNGEILTAGTLTTTISGF